MNYLVIPGLAAALGATLLIAPDLTAQTTDPVAAVKERQQLMKTMSRSFNPIIAVARGDSTDLAEAKSAAGTMRDSMSASLALFMEGTAKGDVDGSRSRPEVWTKADVFKTKAEAMVAAAGALADAPDLDTFKAGVQAAGQACGGCHEGRASSGGEFRFPRE